jgi:hypothetical protein
MMEKTTSATMPSASRLPPRMPQLHPFEPADPPSIE